MNVLRLLLLVVALAAPTLAARAAGDAPVAVATRLLDHLDAGRFTDAEAMFTAEMAAAAPAATLEQVWRSLPAQAGPPKGRGTPVEGKAGGFATVVVPLPHATMSFTAQVAIDGDGRVAGFLVRPDAPPPRAVAADAPYLERDLAVGTGGDALPGTLTLPRGKGPFPAVVLVHGSGPHDRDETIGPNRPFLDIARGLAARGIASLRYDKATKHRPQAFAGRDFTIDDETTGDAVAAVAALRAVEGVDAARVFVLGHSQGGMMAPRIASKSGDVAGLVLLAAPARRLLDILVEQNRRLAVLGDGRTDDAERAAIAALEAQVAAVRAAEPPAADASPMGLPAAYWRSTDAVDPVAEAKRAGLPMLLLQGARDIQVVDADWQLWRGAFHDDDRVIFKLYPALNHLGIAGEGEGSLAEYMRPGHVDATLVGDIADWITK